MFSFVHIEDLVSGHLAAMYKGQVGERYLLSGENASLIRVFDIAAAITKTSKPRLHIPMWLIELYAWISVFFARLTGKLPLISYPVRFFLCILYSTMFQLKSYFLKDLNITFFQYGSFPDYLHWPI